MAERIAVVGASSQIGKALVPRLVASGYEPYCIGRSIEGFGEGITTYVFKELSGSFVPPLDRADVVISLAPLPSIQGVVKMAQSLRAKRIIAFGSTGRFSKAFSTSAIEQDFVLQQERAEIFFSTRCQEIGVHWTLFRPTMIYGADSDLNVSFIKSMIRRFGFFPIPFGANGLRQPVHVDDLADACVSVLGSENTANKAYNLGGGEVLCYSDLVKRIFRAEGRLPILIPVPLRLFFLILKGINKFSRTAFVRKEMIERMYQDLTTDNQAAQSDFGYSPRPFDIEDKPARQVSPPE